MQHLIALIGRLLSPLIGRFRWSPPPWMVALGRHGKPLSILLLLAIAATAAYQYYSSLPKPLQYMATVSPPGLSRISDEQLIPQSLEIEFHYDREAMVAVSEDLGPPSVARLELLDQVLHQGIRMEPELAGEWRWQSDRLLTFKPERDWPAGQRYKLTLGPELFTDNVPLADNELAFTTPEFTASLASLEFYQDPADRAIRRVVASLGFSHAVDEASLKQHLSLAMRPSGSAIDTAPEHYGFTITLGPHKRQAHIHSEPITLPEKSNHMKLQLTAGVKSLSGPGVTRDPLSGEVRIPDLYSFFRVEQSESRIVHNEKGEPEQIVSIAFTDDVASQVLLDAIELYLLPQSRRYWQGPREVTAEVLRQAQKIEWQAIPNQRDAERRYSLRIDAAENRQLYLRVAGDISSIGGFRMADDYDVLLRTPAYPREVKISSEGSLLALSGEHRLGLLSRNLDALRVNVGRVLPGQINHLISQTHGDIGNPAFGNYRFSEENLSAYDSEVITLSRLHPKQANHAAFDLGPYLRQGVDDYGLFFVTVEGWDPAQKRRIYGVEDKRLVLLTDLGLIVKDNADDSHELFVQSINDGRPVAGAEVQLLGKNGRPVMQAVTDQQGHAVLPGTRGLEGAKMPIVYLVRHGNDLAFLPFDRNSRRLNFSRFDVGGVQRRYTAEDELSAFVFSDRGIYRPGDTVNLAAIVRRQNMSTPPAIPLEVELRNPRGAVVLKKRLTLPELGFLDLDYTSDATAETGQYEAAVYLIRDNRYRGQQIGSVRFAVEEFQPDRLKIKSRLMEAPEKGWIPAEGLKLEVALQNLFGTPAQNRKVSGSMVLAPTAFRFAEYEDYRFDDPLADPQGARHSTSQPLEETTTDADGIARFALPLQEYLQGTYRLTVNVEGFEEGGGRSVSASSAALISPLEALVGYRADGRLGYINKDGERRIRFIAIDRQLQQQALSGLTLRLIEKQTVSTLVRQDNGTYQYQSVVREKPLQEAPFNIGQDGVDYAVPTDRPGDFVLELESDKGLRLARIDFSVVGEANLDGSLEKNAELNLKLNRSDYRPGDTIEMNITAPYSGSGLITIESDRVHAFKWFRSESNSSMQTIRVPEELEGNAYVNVAFVRAADSPEIFVSPLSYAAAPFTIDRSKRSVAVELEVPEIARPGKPLQIGYRASQPSRLAIFAVDEGILQVAGYKTPQPLDHFLRKRALEVRTQQMVDLILPEFSLLSERAAAGGGMAEEAMARALGSNLNPFSRKAQEAVAFWSGIVEAGPEARTVSFDIPESFGGQLRVMAVAVADEAMGATQERTLVRGPFVISPNMLTVAAPGDEFVVTVGVANLVEGSGAGASITLSAEPSEQLELLGEAQTILSIAEGSEARAQFRLRAKQRPGPASVTFRATMGEEESRISATLSVRPAVPYMASFQSGYEQSGRHGAGLPRKLHAALSEQQVSASASTLVLVDGLNNYLENFPHGCTEQVVSQVFPLIGLMSHPGYADRMAQTHDKVAVLIDRLRGRQLADGGFSFWPGGRTAAHFPSVYVMQFLTEARESGYAVPGDIYSRGLGYLRVVAGRGADSLESARVRAMAIYLLTRNGEVTTNDLVHLQEWLQQQQPKQWRRDLAAVYMAATYRLLKKEEEANRLVDGYTIGAGGAEGYSDFYSPLTRDAQYLYLLAGHFPERLKALGGEGIRELVAPVFGGHYNTIGSAWTILALGAYSKAVLGPVADEQIAISELVGDAAKRLAVQRRPFVTATPSLQANGVRIEGEQPFFYQVTQAGYDRELPAQALIEGLEVQRDYLDSEGKAVTTLRQGAEVTVRLRIRSVGHKQLSNVAVIDLLPGGFEVIRSSVPRKAGPWRSDYVDIREDRVVFYGSFGSSVTELRYRAKLTAAGEFSVPPAYAESMYNRSLHGRSTAGSFSVAPSE